MVPTVGGCSVGSLYQYYPSKEAVLSDIFKSIVEEEWNRMLTCFNDAMNMDFEEGIQHNARSGLAFIRRLHRLNPSFYQQYSHCYLPFDYHDQRLDIMQFYTDQAEKQFIALFRKHPRSGNLTETELEKIAFVYGRGRRLS